MKIQTMVRVFFIVAVLICPLMLFAQNMSSHEYTDGGPEKMKLSKTCKGCHPDIYTEWSETMHSKSSFTKDALHNSMLELYQNDLKSKGQPVNNMCALCHIPMVNDLPGLMSGTVTADENDPRVQEGIGCHFCHSIVSVQDGMPAPVYNLKADGSVQGPGLATKTTPFHEIHKNENFENEKVCTGCHGYLMNPMGVQICSLQQEEWNGKNTCQECHMKKVDGKPSSMSERATHRSHRMTGGTDLKMLASAASMDLELSKADGTITVNVIIANKSAHKLPSTMPMRMVVLKVMAVDSTGNVVWENFKMDPAKEDPQALFIKLFGKGDKVGVPTWEAETIVMDTRIPSGETITRTYTIAAENVKSVKATLLYFAVPPPAIEMFNLKPDGFIEVPHPITSASKDV